MLRSRVRKLYILGVLSIVVAYLFISLAILMAPWFSFRLNALSDLGNSVRSRVAFIFNFGLACSSFILVVYVFTCLVYFMPKTSILMAVTSFTLCLIAVFDEVYGRIHFIVSVAFFTLSIITLLTYFIELRKTLGLVGGVLSFLIWLLYYMFKPPIGVSVPELLSSIIFSIMVVDTVLTVRDYVSTL